MRRWQISATKPTVLFIKQRSFITKALRIKVKDYKEALTLQLRRTEGCELL